MRYPAQSVTARAGVKPSFRDVALTAAAAAAVASETAWLMTWHCQQWLTGAAD